MPADTAVAMPVVDPIVATVGAPLLHVPPGVGLLSVVVVQKDNVPVMGASGFTVTVTDAVQPAAVV